MKGLWQRLFAGRNHLSLEELQEALAQVEKDRRKNRREVRRWERKRKQTLDKMKKQRASGNQLEVDYLWEEFKEQRRMGTELRREGRLYNVEGIALRRTVKALERLERRKDTGGSRALLDRIRASGLLERVAIEAEGEREYLEEMNSILAEFDGVTEEEQADPEKALFLAELDSIRKSEEDGDADQAAERQEELLERFGDLEEER